MALPKKGIRKITVNEVEYYYSVKLEYQDLTIQTIVGLVEQQNKHFHFSVKFGDKNIATEKSEKFNPGTITPKIVSQAINFITKETEWSSSNKKINLFYSDNSFSQIN